MAVIAVMLTASSLAGGWLGDRYGHKKIQLLASIISSAACALLLSARTTQSVLIFGSFLGVGVGLFLTSNWANASRLAPPAEAGKYLGLTNLATAGAGAFARLGGPLIDVLNHWKPGVFLGYSALFLFGAVLTLLSAFVIGRKDFN
jgi:MFS family permease